MWSNKIFKNWLKVSQQIGIVNELNLRINMLQNLCMQVRMMRLYRLLQYINAFCEIVIIRMLKYVKYVKICLDRLLIISS